MQGSETMKIIQVVLSYQSGYILGVWTVNVLIIICMVVGTGLLFKLELEPNQLDTSWNKIVIPTVV